MVGHQSGLSGYVAVAFFWGAISLDCVWATSFTSTGSHSSRFYVHENLCAVITIYIYSNLVLVISYGTVTVGLFVIRQMCGGSPLTLIIWKSRVVTLTRMDREAQERIWLKLIRN